MTPNLKFYLDLGGAKVRTLADLEQNFYYQDVVDLYRRGVLSRWLKAQGEDDKLARLEKSVTREEPDSMKILRALLNAFGFESSPESIQDAEKVFAYKTLANAAPGETMDPVKVEQVVLGGHFQAYANLKAEICKKRDDEDFLNSAAKQIEDKYIELFKSDFINYDREIFETVGEFFFILAERKQLRRIMQSDGRMRDLLNNAFLRTVELYECGHRDPYVLRNRNMKYAHINQQENYDLNFVLHNKIFLYLLRGIPAEKIGHWFVRHATTFANQEDSSKADLHSSLGDFFSVKSGKKTIINDFMQELEKCGHRWISSWGLEDNDFVSRFVNMWKPLELKVHTKKDGKVFEVSNNIFVFIARDGGRLKDNSSRPIASFEYDYILNLKSDFEPVFIEISDDSDFVIYMEY